MDSTLWRQDRGDNGSRAQKRDEKPSAHIIGPRKLSTKRLFYICDDSAHGARNGELATPALIRGRQKDSPDSRTRQPQHQPTAP